LLVRAFSPDVAASCPHPFATTCPESAAALVFGVLCGAATACSVAAIAMVAWIACTSTGTATVSRSQSPSGREVHRLHVSTFVLLLLHGGGLSMFRKDAAHGMMGTSSGTVNLYGGPRKSCFRSSFH